MTHPTPQPGVLDIAPYVGGESKLDGVDRIIKLASNENPLGCSPKAREALKAMAGEMHRYPDGGASGLRAALGKRYGLDPARIVCGSGSDELIGLLCHAYAGPGDEVLYTEHGFLMYPIYAKGAGATPVKAPETDLRADVDKLLAAVTDKTRILFLANPNNPTGTYVSAEDLRRLREGLRDDILLVIDAAYAEYVGSNDYSPGLELAQSTDNTVMTRTFSKAYGLPALRLGWAYGPEGVIDVINRVRGPFNVNAAALAAGQAAVEDPAFIDLSKEHNDYWLDQLSARLRALGIDVPTSVGNFILARFKDADQASRADDYLRNRGLIVRRMAGYGLPESLRITIGSGEENEILADALSDYMQGE
ncbi:histidinol-phosphate transaminase [Magnetospira sp. QH-2]|uniref:histidinol-phosphate transaminase n=1 Tax=Magnetospira sp. (strain QH-2) TaxID=1288970 RepID=UPI0003E80C14|nr:histidinol-phosphate transaminase [Magnetospira sp. QH-2]CCQ74816.1 histidinol-phosphate aminotransferase [Magnetospira sp. QH-2]